MKTVLIANRGEIALRIIRACRELGIKTVAVYSEADDQSLHVQLADAAICIGPAASSSSYLRAERIISAAEIADVDAIHPGYGFLSENADFAEQCESCNIKFIGPRSTTIRMMGDKSTAKSTVKKAKVPTVPGSEGPIDNERDAQKVAKQIGFPVIIKAVSGGGGKGMRIVRNAVSLPKEYNTARNEAEKAFGDGRVYIEKFIENPRHIEIQIMADEHGKVLHFGERDCSVQRRHQKLIEEAPSPVLSADLRRRMGMAAVRAAKACGYQNAGTIEFLLDDKNNFYFIEMNTRIQVEHGVTEEVYDIDLVKWQLRIAMGEKLPMEQKDIVIKRHAIEARICAESPARNFAPSPGMLKLHYPSGGIGIRIDTHVYGGYIIPPHYDSMISKVIAVGATREEAITRMQRALGEYLVRGIDTTIPFTKAIMADPVFRSGKANTGYIEDFLARTPKEMFSESTRD